MNVQSSDVTDSKAKLLPKFSLAFFNRPRLTALLWLTVTLFGVLSYTTFLKREGFPNVSIPIVMVNGSYAVNDASKVDATVAGPVSKAILSQTGVSTVTTESEANFFTATVQYKEGTDTNQAKQALERSINQSAGLPQGVKLKYLAPYFGVTGPSTDKVDATISVYRPGDTASLTALTDHVKAAVSYLNQQKHTEVDHYFLQDPFTTVTQPATGQALAVQRTFDRYGKRDGNRTVFDSSVIIGVASVTDADAIKLDTEIRSDLARLGSQPAFAGLKSAVSASYAPSITDSLSELQRVLLEGLIAVLVIGSIIIAIRASIITVISMLTVIASTVGVIYLAGNTLNVITLFAVILGLSLIVDDTIIMVEAIDSARRRSSDSRHIIEQATRKIGRAMVAATFTAVLSFTPLLFVVGVLGSFIRAIPVTIISSLLISLLVALIFIPLFARFGLLGTKQLTKVKKQTGAAGIEARIARFITRPMAWAQHHRGREFGVGIAALCIGFLFIAGGGFIFQKVSFNIFPPTKDTNELAVNLVYPPATSVTQAAAIAAQADTITARTLGDNLVAASYYGTANGQMASLNIELIPYAKRDATAPQLVDKLQAAFASFGPAKVSVNTVDVGPPSSGFTISITASDRPKAEHLATDMARYLKGYKLHRPSGTDAVITDVSVANTDIYHRTDNRSVLSVTATFDGTDTTTLTTIAQKAVTDHYNAAELSRFGLQKSDVTFDIGQESENQDSFKTLALAFPIVLLAIYLLLALQFRSLLQPILIFMALPFSFFGISLGLYLTNNSFSFFALLGFFALIGLSIKNTILLTDYANQARRGGATAVDAAIDALSERFRPLIATSLTAVVSLIPLAITSPFWEGLAVVLICGLLASTFLVITIFPYYYLGGEYMRMKVSRKRFFIPLVANVVLIVLITFVFKTKALLPPALITLNIVLLLLAFSRVRRLVAR